MPRTKLTTKLTLAVSFISTLIILIAGLIISAFYYYASEKDIQAYLIDQSQIIVSEQIVFNQDQIMYRPSAQGDNLSTRLGNHGISAIIFDTQLEPLATYGIYNALSPERIQSMITTSQLSKVISTQKPHFTHTTSQDGRIYEAYSLPILSSGQVVGIMQFAKETPIISRIVPLNLTLLAFILPLVGLLNSLVVGFIIRRSLLPLNQLVDHLRHTPATTIPSKIQLTGATDEVSQAAHTLNDLLDQVSASLSQQKDFIAHASHELKTPLTGAISSLDLALSTTSQSSPAQKYIAQTKASLLTLNQTITSLLTLSRLTSSSTLLSKSDPFQLKQAIANVLLLHRHVVAQKGLEINVNCPENIKISLPLEHFQIVLSNLLDNACKFSHPHGKVTITAVSPNQHVSLTISDTGPGMTATEIDQIYNRFYRGRSTANIKGSGLGMAIVKFICDLHHIQINIVSAPDQGTTITLRF